MNSKALVAYRIFLGINGSEPLVPSHIWLEKQSSTAILRRRRCFFLLNPASMNIPFQGKLARNWIQQKTLSMPRRIFQSNCVLSESVSYTHLTLPTNREV